jgi:hypothetical protein
MTRSQATRGKTTVLDFVEHGRRARDRAAIREAEHQTPNLVDYMRRKGLCEAEMAAFCRNEWRASDWSHRKR